MIVLDNVSKVYRGHNVDNEVLRGVHLTIPRGDSIGVCGANGAGKSTLMKLIAGVERPTTGKVTRTMSVSWPIGYSTAFHPHLTGADNAKFVARIYGADERDLLAFVEDFAQLGSYLNEPIRTYSAGMAARLAFGVSLAIKFDCYLVDEVTGAGDERFKVRAEEALHERRENGTLVMVSHDTGTLFRYCKRGAVVYGGSVTLYDTIAEAADVHHRLQSLGARVGQAA
ncbi:MULTISPECIES: ABC transporter ATP-binding protein [unclassified Sphingomonas]|uniref:ABC transporter ATP-binding protein n=1 Tax=unclassified Sphingomonas TaxID=196159 RepID=UPI001D12174F|nr:MULTISPECIES: ABC transporter ATP-binding protein [unclassified Sphingomonas]MCC2978673.1 ABC transporter ATP-binding protein [Sphingomonas sp. IC4-52]MCD2316040.1 ABC transporter ATP-binding protein [Sphingomonas sp. IC-11]